MPLCIAGMHRSGTSLIANLLHVCGLDLGPATDLLPAADNNPQGFWESRSFLRLNDALLKELGGSWMRPARLDVPGWENERYLERLDGRARNLLKVFDGREPWGWKDPRNCLTLPWWQRLLPRMKVLICVRNPLAVAESLRVRDGFSSAASFDLWLTYNRRLLAAAPRQRRLVTHCDSYFLNPQAELGRVLSWCGLHPSAEQRDRACQRVNPSLVHHRTTVADLERSGASPDLIQCYRDLCEEADFAVDAPAVDSRCSC